MRALAIALLLTTSLLATPSLPKAQAAALPVNFAITALFSGWNSTLPPGTFSACSPSGTAACNPTVGEFRGVTFTVTVQWKDVQHNFAIYTKGTLPSAVSTAHTCNPPGTSACWAKSATVSSAAPTATVSFTPTVPADDFTGPGGYEFFCQFHPNTMHGKLQVTKSPDVNGDRVVDIVDIATVALAFDTIPTSPRWNIVADLDNNGTVDIVDVASAAIHFGQTL